MLGSGFLLLKKGGKKQELATGIVAGAGAKLPLNLIDKFVFKDKGVLSLHGYPGYYSLSDYNDEKEKEEGEEINEIVEELQGEEEPQIYTL